MGTASDDNIKTVLAIIILAIAFSFQAIVAYTTHETVTITVNKTENKVKDGNDRYMVYTDGAVYTNKDSWLFLKFNSSDLHNEIKVGATYEAKVSGIRLGFFSWYKNIISIEQQ